MTELNYDPSKNSEKKIILSKNSYIIIDQLSDALCKYGKDTFISLFNLHPEVSNVVMFDRNIKSPRFHQTYLKTPKYTDKTNSYMFCGAADCVTTENPLPILFQPFFDYFNSFESEGDKYNQVVINWYENGSHYCSPHGDYVTDMKEKANIVILTLNENDELLPCRIFRIKPREETLDRVYSKVDILSRHGSIIKMEGDMQSEFRHAIPKCPDPCSRRISFTLRKF